MGLKHEDWFNAECGISVQKFKGQENTIQMFMGTKPEILTCISTMTEQLLKKKIITVDELMMAVNAPMEMGRIKNLKKEGK